MVCVRPCKLPANKIVAPNSPKARAQLKTRPCCQRTARQRQRDIAKERPTGRAIDAGGIFDFARDGLKANLRGANVKRRRDEGLRDDDRSSRERQADAEGGERIAEDASPPKCHQQGQPCYRRRQDNRQFKQDIQACDARGKRPRAKT